MRSGSRSSTQETNVIHAWLHTWHDRRLAQSPRRRRRVRHAGRPVEVAPMAVDNLDNKTPWQTKAFDPHPVKAHLCQGVKTDDPSLAPPAVPEANNDAPLLRNKLPRQGGMNLISRSRAWRGWLACRKLKPWESDVCDRAGR